jgi:hypothetical protein
VSAAASLTPLPSPSRVNYVGLLDQELGVAARTSGSTEQERGAALITHPHADGLTDLALAFNDHHGLHDS